MQETPIDGVTKAQFPSHSGALWSLIKSDPLLIPIYIKYFFYLVLLSRISLTSVLAGCLTLIFAPQAQDLFFDLRSNWLWWGIYWSAFYVLLLVFWLFPVYVSSIQIIKQCDEHRFKDSIGGQFMHRLVPIILVLCCLLALLYSQAHAWWSLIPLENRHSPDNITEWPLPQTPALILGTALTFVLFISLHLSQPPRLTGKYIIKNALLIMATFAVWACWYGFIDPVGAKIGETVSGQALILPSGKPFELADLRIILFPVAFAALWVLFRGLSRGYVDRVAKSDYLGSTFGWISGVLVLALLLLNPFWLTSIADKAQLFAIFVGIWIPLFSRLTYYSTRSGFPVVILLLVVLAVLAGWSTPNRVAPSDSSHSQVALTDALKGWKRANGCEGENHCDKQLLLVAAQGGASRSAFYTASVLGHFLDQNPDIAPNRIFAMSGVSGGSVGLAFYAAALHDGQYRKPPCRAIVDGEANGTSWDARSTKAGVASWFRSTIPLKVSKERNQSDYHTKWRDCLQVLTSGDFLSPVFVRLLGTDFLGLNWLVRWAFGQESGADRGIILEQAWERQYLRVAGHDTLNEDFLSFAPDLTSRFGWQPLLLLNGTSVETGRRVIASHLHPMYCSEKGDLKRLFSDAYDLHDLLSTVSAGDQGPDCDCVKDSVGAAYSVRCKRQNQKLDVKLSAAASMSARFPIISPQVDITTNDEDHKLVARVVDGGYFENHGATTLIDLATALLSIDPDLRIKVILLTNDPTFEDLDCLRAAPDAAPPAPAAPKHPVWSEFRSIFGAALETRNARGANAAINLCKMNRPVSFIFQHIGVESVTDPMAASGAEPSNKKADDASKRSVAGSREKKKTEVKVEDISMSWWLSFPVQQYLDRKIERDVIKADN